MQRWIHSLLEKGLYKIKTHLSTHLSNSLPKRRHGLLTALVFVGVVTVCVWKRGMN